MVEEIGAEWIRCATMGSTRPKPDYAVGLSRKVFSKSEREKLDNYVTIDRPFYFTPELCFPFLVCEVKTAEAGLTKADRQNIHSASIAVKAIISLYEEAFLLTEPDRVHDLLGKVLVFSVSHNNNFVWLYGHFAIRTDSTNNLSYHRYPNAHYSLVIDGGAERLKSYNFVMNLYEKFAPDHLKRIQLAIAALRTPKPRTANSLIAMDPEISSSVSQGEYDGVFKRPSKSASALQREQTEALQKQVQMLIETVAKQSQIISSLQNSAASKDASGHQ